MSDHYQTLGVKTLFLPSEIEEAYREICERFHPEKHSDNALREPQKRKSNRLNWPTQLFAIAPARMTRNRTGVPETEGAATPSNMPPLSPLLSEVLKGLLVKVLWIGMDICCAACEI